LLALIVTLLEADPGVPAMSATSSGEEESTITKAEQRQRIRFVMRAGANDAAT
jgi:hypothetical protein